MVYGVSKNYIKVWFTAVERINLYLQFVFLLSAVRFFFTELLNVEAKMIGEKKSYTTSWHKSL